MVRAGRTRGVGETRGAKAESLAALGGTATPRSVRDSAGPVRCRVCRRGWIIVFPRGEARAGRRVRCTACRGTGMVVRRPLLGGWLDEALDLRELGERSGDAAVLAVRPAEGH